jgi:hypothetical protein
MIDLVEIPTRDRNSDPRSDSNPTQWRQRPMNLLWIRHFKSICSTSESETISPLLQHYSAFEISQAGGMRCNDSFHQA